MFKKRGQARAGASKKASQASWSPLFSGLVWLLFLFQFLTLFLVFIFRLESLRPEFLSFSAGLVVSTMLALSLLKRISRGEVYLLLIAAMIYSIGVVMIYRMEPDYGRKQLLLYLASLALFFLAFFFLRWTGPFWEDKTWFFYLLTLAFFLLTLVLGRSFQGAKNWIRLFGIQIQPSEFAKIPFVFFVASWYKNYEKYARSFLGRFSLSIAVYLLLVLFLLQRELGTAMIFFAVLLLSQLSFEDHWWMPFLNLALAIVGLYFAYKLFGHVRIRFAMWQDPWQDPNGKGYQILQALFAIAEGGFFGRGLGLGQPNRIPVGHSDFIFASVIEEMGMFMGICLVLLFILLIYRGFKIAMDRDRDFPAALAVAISSLFAAQAFIMFAGTIKLIPLTGITIPFLTYGGSSLLSSFLLLAILQYCSESRGGLSYEKK